MSKDLFRQEAIDHQSERLKGDVILSQPVSYLVITIFISVITFLALFFLWQNGYHRKQEVFGYLIPDKGLIKMNAPRGGRLRQVMVNQDEIVEENSPIFTVQVEQTINGEDLISEQALQNLYFQEQKILQKIELEKHNSGILDKQNNESSLNLDLELIQLNSLLSNERRLLTIKKRALERARTLYEQGLISTADLDTVNSAFLEQQNSVKNFEFRRRESEGRRQVLNGKKETNNLLSQRELINLEATLIELKGRQIRLNADNINHVFSPVSGVVASINGRAGQVVDPQHTVLSIIPVGSSLQAELYVPTRAIGFLAEEQEVRVRYDAFPYQKFGVQKAYITDISKSIVYPEDLPQGLPFKEPVYRVVARLDTQSIKAFGEEKPLRSGMQLKADVILEERSLLEWLLEPLFSIRGKVK